MSNEITVKLVRDITEFMPKEKNIAKLTFKNKQIDNNGNILNQSKINCKIENAYAGKLFLKAIGYIKENDTVYKYNNLELIVKDIENRDKLLEIETGEKFMVYWHIDAFTRSRLTLTKKQTNLKRRLHIMSSLDGSKVGRQDQINLSLRLMSEETKKTIESQRRSSPISSISKSDEEEDFISRYPLNRG